MYLNVINHTLYTYVVHTFVSQILIVFASSFNAFERSKTFVDRRIDNYFQRPETGEPL